MSESVIVSKYVRDEYESEWEWDCVWMRYGIEILPLPVMGGQVSRSRESRVRGKGKGRR